jgi:hypothetical protein
MWMKKWLTPLPTQEDAMKVYTIPLPVAPQPFNVGFVIVHVETFPNIHVKQML